jgi:hypothetical protein
MEIFVILICFSSAFAALNLTKENDDEAYFPRLPELPMSENPSEEQVIVNNVCKHIFSLVNLFPEPTS